MTTNPTPAEFFAPAPPDAPYWMDCEDRFRFWERNGISDHDRDNQIRLTLAAYTDVPEWQLPDAKERFVAWCNWFSDFCFEVNNCQHYTKDLTLSNYGRL